MIGQFLRKPRPCHALKILSKECPPILTTVVIELTTRITHSTFMFYISTCACDLDTKVTCEKPEITPTDRCQQMCVIPQGEAHNHLFFGIYLRRGQNCILWHYISEPVISEVMTWFAKTQVVKLNQFEVMLKRQKKKTMVHKFQSSDMYFISSVNNGWCIVI